MFLILFDRDCLCYYFYKLITRVYCFEIKFFKNILQMQFNLKNVKININSFFLISTFYKLYILQFINFTFNILVFLKKKV